MAFKKIQQYISTADGVAGTLLIPKLILPTLIEEVDKFLVPREMAAIVLGEAQLANQGGTFNVNLETEGTFDVREVGEGAEVPLDAIGHEAVEVKPAKYGVALRIKREMIVAP